MTIYRPKYMSLSEEAILRKLFEMLAAAGWNLHSVDDGGALILARSPDEALEVIDSVGDSRVRFASGGRSAIVLVIVGNEVDIITDYGCAFPDFDAVMEAHGEWVEENYQ